MTESQEPYTWHCSTCGRANTGQHCDWCIRQACRVCHKPIFQDESYSIDALGYEHMRCMSVATSRPKAMGEPKRAVHYWALSKGERTDEQILERFRL